MLKKGHVISAYLFALFITLISAANPYAPGGRKAEPAHGTDSYSVPVTPCAKGYLTDNLSSDDKEQVQVKLRVRYKASYCDCTLTPPFEVQYSFYYTPPVNFATREYRFSFRPQLSLLLRGPPAVFC